MKSGSENEGGARRGLTRRELLQAGAVAGLGAGLLGSSLGAAACGSSGDSSSSTSPAASGSAAASQLKPGGIFTLATDQLFPKDNLNPLTNTTDGVDALEGMIREGLVTYDFSFTPQPRLAESFEANAEATEYTFHIRPNVTWHDGSAFTARDAAWSLERIMSPEGGSGMMDRLSASIEKNGVQVVDDMTLKLSLKRPDSLLLLALSNQQCYLTKENSKDSDFEKGIGTGPFMLKSWNPGQSYEVEKYPGYWMDGAPVLDGVRGVQIPEASTKLQSVASGSSSVTQIAFDQLPVVNANSNLQITPYEKGITYNVVMLCTVKPFSDPRVRQAMKLSLDRKIVMDVAYAGQAFASPDAWVAMEDPFMDETLNTAATTMDRAKAQELMAAAGYPDGIDLTLKAPGDPLHANFSLAVVAGLKGSPFRVTAKQIPAATYWDTVWMKDPFCVDDWNRRHPVETAALNCYPNAPWNESQWKSDKMAELLDKAYASQGDALTQATTDVCNFMREGDDGGGSGELIPAYLNRLWTGLKTTKVVPWTFSMLDMRQCGFYA
jgi:peptide/nickel transport system substrate-binding protein